MPRWDYVWTKITLRAFTEIGSIMSASFFVICLAYKHTFTTSSNNIFEGAVRSDGSTDPGMAQESQEIPDGHDCRRMDGWIDR